MMTSESYPCCNPLQIHFVSLYPVITIYSKCSKVSLHPILLIEFSDIADIYTQYDLHSTALTNKKCSHEHITIRSPSPVQSVGWKGIKPPSTGLWRSENVFSKVLKLKWHNCESTIRTDLTDALTLGAESSQIESSSYQYSNI